MRRTDEESNYRAERRKHYFENPCYRKWSDMYSINEYGYGDLRERAFLRRYLDCNDSDDNKALSKMHEVLKNGKDPPIDWVAFYAYFDERINDLENPYIHEMTEELFFFLDDSPSVIKLIDQYRETLLSLSYDII